MLERVIENPQNVMTVVYLLAAILFIGSLGGLATQESARRGNTYGMIGMVIAVVMTILQLSPDSEAYVLVGLAMVLGAAVGVVMAIKVAMTAMPQMVALLHSFVGLAAVLVGVSTYVGVEPIEGAQRIVHEIEVWLGVAIGAITFTGSLVSWGKLRGSISGRPLLLPGRHALNGVVVLGIVGLAVPFISAHGAGLTLLLVMTLLASLLGVHLVMAIGGADMPVVVSLLNSYSGWAASAAGFMLGNDLLIITGALVGSSGAILSYIMCEAMNRSIWSVVFGGFGTGDAKSAAPPADGAEQGEVQPVEADEVSDLLKEAKNVILVPGYGMAVARAQHPVEQLTRTLREKNIQVRYAIHPVAGRLPGHMNVLLAEAGVPYDIVLEMDEINDEFPETDVVLVIGANDIVNPGAQTDASSPIYGMPVLEAWKASNVIVLKRSMNVGYAGVANPLFFNENTQMLFGDARDSIEKIVAAMKLG